MSLRRDMQHYLNVALCLGVLSGAAGCATTGHPRSITPRSEIEALAEAAARRHGVKTSLLLGVINVESGFRTDARSHAGARGLMQLMPKTAASLASRLGLSSYDVEDPTFNIEAGTLYLAYLLRLFDGNENLALAAYNTGPVRVRRWQRQGKPLAGYSLRYVAAVKHAQRRFERGATVPRPTTAAHTVAERDALRALIRKNLYGRRPDLPLDDAEAPTPQPTPPKRTPQ